MTDIFDFFRRRNRIWWYKYERVHWIRTEFYIIYWGAIKTDNRKVLKKGQGNPNNGFSTRNLAKYAGKGRRKTTCLNKTVPHSTNRENSRLFFFGKSETIGWPLYIPDLNRWKKCFFFGKKLFNLKLINRKIKMEKVEKFGLLPVKILSTSSCGYMKPCFSK